MDTTGDTEVDTGVRRTQGRQGRMEGNGSVCPLCKHCERVNCRCLAFELRAHATNVESISRGMG